MVTRRELFTADLVAEIEQVYSTIDTFVTQPGNQFPSLTTNGPKIEHSPLKGTSLSLDAKFVDGNKDDEVLSLAYKRVVHDGAPSNEPEVTGYYEAIVGRDSTPADPIHGSEHARATIAKVESSLEDVASNLPKGTFSLDNGDIKYRVQLPEDVLDAAKVQGYAQSLSAVRGAIQPYLNPGRHGAAGIG